MTKSFALIDSNNIEIVNTIQKYFIGKDVTYEKFNDINNKGINIYEIVVLTGFNKIEIPEMMKDKIILNIHPSLLPSFKGNNALRQSYTSGIKVGGITIHQVSYNNFYDKIFSQYPVLIGYTTHFNEYKEEIIAVGQKLYPLVIESILNDTVFDFNDIFKTSCSGGCSNSACSICEKSYQN